MNPRRESKHEHYDVIVVGSGVGGLSAAALLAHAGRKVLVVERHDRPGGYAHGFQRRRYNFDSAVHNTSGCVPIDFGTGALIDDVLRALGVRDDVTFHQVSAIYTAIYPGFRMEAPVGLQNFIAAHAEHFPDQERGLRQLLRLCTRFNREIKRLPPDATAPDVTDHPDDLPLLNQYGGATLSEVMDEFLDDDRLKALLGTQWGYMGLPPSRLAFVRWSAMVMSYLHSGAYYCAGGFQKLVDLLAASLVRDDGELLLRTAVRKIMVEGTRVVGVQLENGQRISAPVVISNADATMTFEELIGVQHVPAAYLSALRGMRRSLSAVSAYFATDVDLSSIEGVGHETFVFNTWDHDAAYDAVSEGKTDAVTISIPTLVDASLAPAGEHLLVVTSLVAFDAAPSWRESKDETLARLQAVAEDVFPALRGHITFAEAATPRTMERYTLNTEGCIYGWEQSPEQSGVNRLPRRTPIDGLYLSGAWTQPGGGLVPVFVSGLETAAVVLGRPDVSSMLHAPAAELSVAG